MLAAFTLNNQSSCLYLCFYSFLSFPLSFFCEPIFLCRGIRDAFEDLQHASTDDSHLVYIVIILLSQYMTMARVFIALIITPKGLLSDISAL